MQESRHFTLIVAGDNPEELVKKYDGRKMVDPYVVFKFSDAKTLHKKYIKLYEQAKEHLDEGSEDRFLIEEQLNLLNTQDDTDFFLDLAESYEIDDNTGDAISRRNPYGKYDSCKLAKNFAVPLINKDGEETFSEIKSNIDWSKIHMANKEVYEFAWDSVMENKKPKTEEEKVIYENMKNRTQYFNEYGTRDNYVASNTSFWGYAFLSENTEWIELEPTVNQFDWVKSFYSRFIEPLKGNTKISVYECVRHTI